MRWLVACLAVASGCGGTTPAVDNRCHDCGPGRTPTIDAHAEEARHAVLCERSRALATAGCVPFDRMDPQLLTGTCAAVVSFQLAGMDECLLESTCDALAACIARTREAADARPYMGPRRACQLPKDHPDLLYPAGVSREELLASYGATARTYADAPSTKDQPIEVCGFLAAGEWLARTACKDGSHPLASRADAERVRVGNVGEGGRCGRFVDQYAVDCPETTYDIFIDAYRCQR